MQSKIFASIIISLLLVTIAWAQEPPGWVPLGNLGNTQQVRDILEIPGTSILLAGAHGPYGYAEIWRSANGGQSWTYVCGIASGTEFIQLERNPVSGRIWALRPASGSNTIYYSNDTGQTWTGVSGPSSDPAVTGNSIKVIGDYVYFGGTIGAPYSICLYRLHQDSLTWEMVNSYPQCNAITRLEYHNNKLVVFCRDRSQPKVRVFTHIPSQLDKEVISIGKAEVSEVVTKKEK